MQQATVCRIQIQVQISLHPLLFPKGVCVWGAWENDKYRLCVQDCELDGVNWVFRNIFNSQFNLSFHKPNTNTCKQCDICIVNHSDAATDEEKEKIKGAWADNLELDENN